MYLKKARDCPAQQTGMPGMTDLETDSALTALVADEYSEQATTTTIAAAQAGRIRLLDRLRP